MLASERPVPEAGPGFGISAPGAGSSIAGDGASLGGVGFGKRLTTVNANANAAATFPEFKMVSSDGSCAGTAIAIGGLAGGEVTLPLELGLPAEATDAAGDDLVPSFF